MMTTSTKATKRKPSDPSRASGTRRRAPEARSTPLSQPPDTDEIDFAWGGSETAEASGSDAEPPRSMQPTLLEIDPLQYDHDEAREKQPTLLELDPLQYDTSE